MEASSAALELIAGFHWTKWACLYLDSLGQPICPDPAGSEFPRLTRHFGSVRGAWPRIAET